MAEVEKCVIVPAWHTGIWHAVLVFNPNLLISKNELSISMNRIMNIDKWCTFSYINNYISDINKSFIDFDKSITDIDK